jgi:hypothetical protein
LREKKEEGIVRERGKVFLFVHVPWGAFLMLKCLTLRLCEGRKEGLEKALEKRRSFKEEKEGLCRRSEEEEEKRRRRKEEEVK